MRGNKGFVNVLIVLLLFIPLLYYTLVYLQSLEDEEILTREKLRRLSFYYEDIIDELKNRMGFEELSYSPKTEDIFVFKAFGEIRRTTTNFDVMAYDSEVKSSLSKVGINYSVDFSSVYQFSDYFVINFLTKSGSSSSYFKKYYDTSIYNISEMKVNYFDVGRPSQYNITIYITGNLPVDGDNLSVSNYDPNGVPVYFRVCYPFIGGAKCFEKSTTVGNNGAANYTFYLGQNICGAEGKILILVGDPLGNPNDEYIVQIPSTITGYINSTIDINTSISSYKVSQLYLGDRVPYSSALYLSLGELKKGSKNKVVLDE